MREGALALSGDTGIGEIRELIDGGLPPATGGGRVEAVECGEAFRAAAGAFVELDKISGLKVVLDGGNGMAGPTVGPILDGLALELIPTFWKPDGNFPGHEPNPLLPENREMIMRAVRDSGADLGIAFDGDADRCFFIDETGEFIAGDFVTALLAGSLLRRRPGAAILYDVRASRAVADTVAAAGGTAYRNRVGHAFFKRRMREEGSLFGGEVSGHYYFHDFYCADSGTIPALLMLELCARERRPLSELLAPYTQRYFISGEINSEVADPQAKLAAIAERYADARHDTLDGISIDYDDWHFNVRSSNTEPLLRLCLESLVSHADMERRRDEVLALIRG
jgi:phosphomannomutase